MSRGMTFNGVASSTLHFEYCSPRIPLLPDRRPTTIDLPGRDGTVDFENDSYTSRLIPVDCLMKATTDATLQERLAAAADWLSGSGYIIFDKDTTKRWKGKVYQGSDLARHPLASQFTVVFECQPFAEDVTEIDDAAVDVETDYESPVIFYPQITVTTGAASTSLQVSLTSTGQYGRITEALETDDIVIFDMSTGKVTVNDTLTKVDITSLFFGVPTGDQTITVTADGAYSAVMAYRKRYRYA